MPSRDALEPGRFGELVGAAPAMRALFARSERVAGEEVAVAVVGEAGVGRDALARSLHRASVRSASPLVSVDCAALPVALLESELFGAHHSSESARPAALALARGGTLLLDGVTELPLGTQSRLAEALADGRLGGTRVDAGRPARVIATSRVRLLLAFERGKLQPELYRVLAGCELAIPALRERREDIPLLVHHLLSGLDGAEPPLSLTSEALELLSLHDWPGNVRELRNVIERFQYALGSDETARRLAAVLVAGELPSLERRSSPSREPSGFDPDASYRDERARFEAEFERRYVAWLLDRHDGNLSAAARAADMDRKYLDKLARRHGLKSAR